VGVLRLEEKPMVCVHVIDNLLSSPQEAQMPETPLAQEVSDLIINNMISENQRMKQYSQEEMDKLTGNKSPELLKERLSQGVLVYLTNSSGQLVGCGMIENKGDHYEAKTLHVAYPFRGKGYARLICDVREKCLKDKGISEIYTESLKFEKTLGFHRSRGFEDYQDGRSRRFSVLMRKSLEP